MYLALLGGGTWLSNKRILDYILLNLVTNNNADKEKLLIGYLNMNENSLNNIKSLFSLYDFENIVNNNIDRYSLIIIGGGNTNKLIEDNLELLNKIYFSNKTIIGLSAGAICFFDNYLSDSSSFYSGNEIWNLKLEKGLGLLKTNITPHYNKDGRIIFNDLVNNGIALEDDSCLIIPKDKSLKFQIIYSSSNSKAYLLKLNKLIPLEEGYYERFFETI